MDTPHLPSIDGGTVSARFGGAVTMPVAVSPAPPAAAEMSEVDRRLAHGHMDAEDPAAVLSAALSRRRNVQAEVAALTATTNRLAPLIDAQGTAAAALAAFDAEEASTLRAWAAEASDEPPPSPRTDRRAELVAAAEAAEQRANAARTATKAAEARALELNGSLTPAAQRIAWASMSLLTDKAADLIDRASDALLQLERDVIDLGALELTLRHLCDVARDEKNPAAAAMVARLVRYQRDILFIAPWLKSMSNAFSQRRQHWQAALADIITENDHEHE